MRATVRRAARLPLLACVFAMSMIAVTSEAQAQGIFGWGPKLYVHAGAAGTLSRMASDQINTVIEEAGLWLDTGEFSRALFVRGGIGSLLQVEYRQANGNFDFINQSFDHSTGDIDTNARFDMDFRSTEYIAKVNLLFPFLSRSTATPVVLFGIGGIGQLSYADDSGTAFRFEGESIVFGGEFGVVNRWGSVLAGFRYSMAEFDRIAFMDGRLRGQVLPTSVDGNIIVFEISAAVGIGF